MRRIGSLCCLLMLSSIALGRSDGERFGVAASTGTSLCAAIPADDAHAGERVAIVDPSRPQHASWATLELPETGACAAWQRKADLPGRTFALKAEGVTGDGGGFIGIVVRGASSARMSHGSPAVRTDGGAAFYFRSCTSSEGVHLSAWPSAKPAGQPLWHAYVYLGHDVEPTCTDAETRDAS
jgi:hypothetical protein